MFGYSNGKKSFLEKVKTDGILPFLCSGKGLDEETGLYYYGARYYNPRKSVWLSTDPLSGYNPIFETEHYIDGQHNGGIFNSFNHNTYGYTYQNPVLYVDPNGKQNVFFETQSFAPFSDFGYLIYPNVKDGKYTVGPFKGDNRTHSTDPSATFRIKGAVSLDLAQNKVVKGIQYTTTTTEISTKGSIESQSYLSYNDFDWSFGLAKNTTSFSMHNWGSNKLVTGSPDIDVHVNAIFSLKSRDSQGSVFNVSGSVQGDSFPSQTLILRDTSGKAFILSSFNANESDRNTGPLILLPGNNKRPMGTFNVDITFDSSGNLIKAIDNNSNNKPLQINQH